MSTIEKQYKITENFKEKMSSKPIGATPGAVEAKINYLNCVLRLTIKKNCETIKSLQQTFLDELITFSR
jgi:hypothetical protein